MLVLIFKSLFLNNSPSHCHSSLMHVCVGLLNHMWTCIAYKAIGFAKKEKQKQKQTGKKGKHNTYTATHIAMGGEERSIHCKREEKPFINNPMSCCSQCVCCVSHWLNRKVFMIIIAQCKNSSSSNPFCVLSHAHTHVYTLYIAQKTHLEDLFLNFKVRKGWFFSEMLLLMPVS